MIRKPFFYFFIYLIFMTVIPAILFAQNGWVSDSLILTFREGPGNNFKVIRTIVSNTPVSILEKQNGFLKVEIPNGDVGWVDEKFVIFDPPKAVLLEKAVKEKQSLENQIKALAAEVEGKNQQLSETENQYSSQITPLKDSLAKLTNENKALQAELAQANQKYKTLIEQSKDIQNIIKENKSLKEENEQLSSELGQVKGKNRNLFKTAMIKWFLAGVGVLLLGWLIGQSVSSKKRGYGSLLD